MSLQSVFMDMAIRVLFLGIFCLMCIAHSASADTSGCDDIDTTACQLLIQQRPDLCSDESLANAACKKFCKLCPIECYHCDATVMDFRDCNTTMLCQKGEVCMRKELLSFVDGHHEYQMLCERKELCDGGSQLTFPFGKRNVATRDLSIHCCTEDLCNYPEKLTTTAPTTTSPTTTAHGCKRDIIIVVDESNSLVRSQHTILNFISELVSNFHIGTDGSLVSLATFTSTAVTRWDLSRYTNIYSLKSAINSIHFLGGSGDLDVALSYVVNQASSSHTGNRQNVEDVVIIITDDVAKNAFLEYSLSNQLHLLSHNVIVIGIGTNIQLNELGHIATDSGHVLSVRSPDSLQQSTHLIASLVCH